MVDPYIRTALNIFSPNKWTIEKKKNDKKFTPSTTPINNMLLRGKKAYSARKRQHFGNLLLNIRLVTCKLCFQNRTLKHAMFSSHGRLAEVSTTTFTFLRIFSLVQTISLKIWERPLSLHRCSLPVSVRDLKTSLD